MTRKSIQVKLNKVTLKEHVKDISKISILLSSSSKIFRLKSAREVKCQIVNLFGQSFSFPIEQLPITIIIVKHQLDSNEQINRFQVGKDVLRQTRKSLRNMVFESQSLFLKYECILVSQGFDFITEKSESFHETQHNLDDIDSPKLFNRILTRDFSGKMLNRQQGNSGGSEKNIENLDSLSMRSQKQINLDISNIPLLKLSGSYAQCKTVRVIHTSREKQKKVESINNRSQKLPQKKNLKRIVLNQKTQLSKSTSVKTGSSNSKSRTFTRNLQQVFLGTALGMISGLVLAASVS